MLEELKSKLDQEGYLVHYDTEIQLLQVSAKRGKIRPGTNESATSYVAMIELEENKFKIWKIIVPYHQSFIVDTREEVIDYLLSRFPNVPPGGANAW